MNYTKSVLNSLLASVVVLILIQGCSGEGVRLEEGASFDESSRYALVLFGVGTDPPVLGRGTDGTKNRIRFKKWDLETGQQDGSCFSFRSPASVTIPLPPEEGDGVPFMAFKIFEGSYVGSVNPKAPDEFETVFFTVDPGQAYYVGNLIHFGEGQVRIETNYSDAANWAESHLNVRVPLNDAPIQEYKGGRLYYRMCWP